MATFGKGASAKQHLDHPDNWHLAMLDTHLAPNIGQMPNGHDPISTNNHSIFSIHHRLAT